MISFNWTPREKKMFIALLVVGLVAIGVILLPSNSDQKEQTISLQDKALIVEKKTSESKQQKAKLLVIDLKGAVKNPGIYRVDPDTRLFDVLEQAGGPQEGADLNQVNLAQMLSDGMVVYIPKKGETAPMISQMTGQTTKSQAGSKINVNTATAEDLLQLEGVGPSKAKAIIDYREKNGPFRSVDDLSNVSGIGEKTLAKFRDQITV